MVFSTCWCVCCVCVLTVEYQNSKQYKFRIVEKNKRIYLDISHKYLLFLKKEVDFLDFCKQPVNQADKSFLLHFQVNFFKSQNYVVAFFYSWKIFFVLELYIMFHIPWPSCTYAFYQLFGQWLCDTLYYPYK